MVVSTYFRGVYYPKKSFPTFFFYFFLFIIMATLKPRMEIVFTPVSTILAEWYKVMFRKSFIFPRKLYMVADGAKHSGGGGGILKNIHSCFIYLQEWVQLSSQEK